MSNDGKAASRVLVAAIIVNVAHVSEVGFKRCCPGDEPHPALAPTPANPETAAGTERQSGQVDLFTFVASASLKLSGLSLTEYAVCIFVDLRILSWRSGAVERSERNGVLIWSKPAAVCPGHGADVQRSAAEAGEGGCAIGKGMRGKLAAA